MPFTAPSGIQGIFQKLGGSFGLFEKGGSVLGVDIGSSSIKVVQLSKKYGKVVLETYGELALGPYGATEVGRSVSIPVEKIGEALNDVIREASITTRNAGIAIPLASSLVTIIDMPAVPEGKLAEMVPFEARKYIPIPINEVTLDWRIIPQGGDNWVERGFEELPTDGSAKKGEMSPKSKVLLVAIHNEVLSRYEKIAKLANLTASFIEIEIFSAIRSILSKERAPVLVVDIGAGTTKLSLIENGVVLNSHIINRGSQDITLMLARSHGITVIKAEELKREVGISADPQHKSTKDIAELIVTGIFTEANKVLLDYEKEYRKTITKVFLSGGGSLIKGIMDIAKKNFDGEVVFATPFDKVEAPAFLIPTLHEIGPLFAVSLGVALRKLQEMG